MLPFLCSAEYEDIKDILNNVFVIMEVKKSDAKSDATSDVVWCNQCFKIL